MKEGKIKIENISGNKSWKKANQNFRKSKITIR